MRELAASRQALASAQGQIAELLVQDAARKQELVLLERIAANERAFALRDELTGLANRRLLVDHFDQAVALAARQRKQIALLFLDLDEFKVVNDAFGHSVGDRLLQQVAARLVAGVRASDTVCRLGGDEFVVLLPEVESRDGAVAVSEKVRTQLDAPYVVDGVSIAMTASIGMAVYPGDAKAYADLIRVSDQAMYRDKARGRRWRPAHSAQLDNLRKPSSIAPSFWRRG